MSCSTARCLSSIDTRAAPTGEALDTTQPSSKPCARAYSASHGLSTSSLWMSLSFICAAPITVKPSFSPLAGILGSHTSKRIRVFESSAFWAKRSRMYLRYSGERSSPTVSVRPISNSKAFAPTMSARVKVSVDSPRTASRYEAEMWMLTSKMSPESTLVGSSAFSMSSTSKASVMPAPATGTWSSILLPMPMRPAASTFATAFACSRKKECFTPMTSPSFETVGSVEGGGCGGGGGSGPSSVGSGGGGGSGGAGGGPTPNTSSTYSASSSVAGRANGRTTCAFSPLLFDEATRSGLSLESSSNVLVTVSSYVSDAGRPASPTMATELTWRAAGICRRSEA